ncbi:MAG: hypothetical protein JOZ60_03665 [Verrucomicrobia bacterium]|nr:hypothetical protein [Verrucomicrobiota bacterium]
MQPRLCGPRHVVRCPKASTAMGGSRGDLGNGIAVDAWDNAYVTLRGLPLRPIFPLAHPLPTNSVLRGGGDAFVVKIGTLPFEDKDRAADDGHDADEDR